jgi:hypothetical protein
VVLAQTLQYNHDDRRDDFDKDVLQYTKLAIHHEGTPHLPISFDEKSGYQTMPAVLGVLGA